MFHIANRTLENPYSAAQKFLERNDLPLTYLDEVVKFIEKNTAGVNIGSGSNNFVDPFTGGLFDCSTCSFTHSAPGTSRYQPTGNISSTGVISWIRSLVWCASHFDSQFWAMISLCFRCLTLSRDSNAVRTGSTCGIK